MAEEKVYITVKGYGEARFEEKKSVFIGYCEHVTSEDEALSFVKKIKEKHKDATHNCYGYVMKGGILCRYSDDGEPQGTAGKPILDMLVKSGVDDVCVVVTRYFGGILLGAGGLVRAYTAAAKLAIDEAGIITYEKYSEFRITLNYSDYQKLLAKLPSFNAKIDNTEFGMDVVLDIAMRAPLADRFNLFLKELFNDKIKAEFLGERYDKEYGYVEKCRK